MEPNGEVSKALETRGNKVGSAGRMPTEIITPTELPEPKLTENSVKVLQNRYLKKDKISGEVIEEPKDMFWRVATSVAEPEFEASPEQGDRWSRRFYDLMATGVFMPNSPTLMNAGREMGMLSACFVLPVEDSIDSIFTTLKHVALIQKSGGGTGFSFSRLRPDGDIVASSGGQTSGPLSFIDAYSAGTDAIQQGAFRRGANMGVLRCDHPDVMEFIQAKDDLGRWTNYNVSIAVTNEWMQSVVDNPDAPIVVANPRGGHKAWMQKTSGRRSATPDYEAFAAGEPKPEVEYWTYGEVMDRLIHFAWKNGEPGLLFLDRANEDNMVPNLGDLESTNPCVVADTWVQTSDGPQQVGELVGQPCRVAVDGQLWDTTEKGFFQTGVKKVLRLCTREGQSLRLTADHPVRKVTKNTRFKLESEWTEAGDLNPGDEILLHNHRELPAWEGAGLEEEGYLMGHLLGHGTLQAEAAVLSVWANPAADGTLPSGALAVMGKLEHCASTVSHRSDFTGFQGVSNRNEWRLESAPIRNLAEAYGLLPSSKLITPQIERTGSEFHQAFLRGLFDADGSVQGTQSNGASVRLAQRNKKSLEAVQRMLLRLGIASKIYADCEVSAARLFNGKGDKDLCPTQAQFELVISGDNLAMFAERIGFADSEKQGRMLELLSCYSGRLNPERFVVRVSDLVEDGTEPVFDVQVPGVNAFDANGLMVHNCGEQWLLPYSSCNLGSINLGRFYNKDGAESSDWEDKFAWDAFDSVVHDSVRFLDDVVSINRFPIDQIRDRAEEERRIGLGVMGFADLLYKMGVRYGSEKSFEVARKLSARLFDQSALASEKLVSEDGRDTYQAWEGSTPQIEGKAKRRNSHLTTVAPTGTISIIAGCSGGIEPLFSLAFQRQVMKDADGKPVVMKEVNPAFRKAMEKAEYTAEEIDAVIDVALSEGTVAHAGLNEELSNTFVTAHDVQPAEHIQMQGAWQSSIDNAVSKTINLPNESCEDDVRTAYLLAWREGCKGVTVYRDGCREMQPMALKEKEKAKVVTPVMANAGLVPSTLPEIMPCVRVRQMTPFGNMHVKISVDPAEDREMEVFAQLGKGGDVANSDLEAICRMLSLFLRCGGNMGMALSQLEGIGSSLTVPSKDGRIMSLADGLAKALHKFATTKETHGLKAILLGKVDPANTNLLADKPAQVASGKRIGTGTGGAFKVKCPACEGVLAFEEGCCKCYGCGYSQC
jgi:ribonucleoside-diphosphate reductase alpha chain